MLTAKENMRQVILGGNSDRLVNQYEAINLLFHPFMLASPLLKPGDTFMGMPASLNIAHANSYQVQIPSLVA